MQREEEGKRCRGWEERPRIEETPSFTPFLETVRDKILAIEETSNTNNSEKSGEDISSNCDERVLKGVFAGAWRSPALNP
ncbi:hypothetical protein AKJ57_03675 [candidate division MSBL1 archaeon SCGC-AAA259A05]|uniref:Uncharacterized protein n=1 Tax=candidate division MSBL1 archaeon SCGC-AAA259A05 TaxID=1698259 RepID=A0A133U9B7_9EURY|nr:hypothetical protein AKJ57_03675 [candidate division MSBL1 archaeon SCGC-AAA259A05]